MKKHLLPMLAIAMAVVFSSFDNKPVVQPPVSLEEELYWYRIVNGNIDVALASGEPVTKTGVLTEADCPDVSGDDCARGYTEPQLFGNPAPSVSDPSEHIMKD